MSFVHVSDYLVEVESPNIGESFERFSPEGLPTKLRSLLLSARSECLILRGVPLCARFPSTSTRCVPEGVPKVVGRFHKCLHTRLLFVDEL